MSHGRRVAFWKLPGGSELDVLIASEAKVREEMNFVITSRLRHSLTRFPRQVALLFGFDEDHHMGMTMICLN
jgi:hypothetical protein